jgi:hypothetical protein
VRRPLVWVVMASLGGCLSVALSPAAFAGPQPPTLPPLPCVDVGVGALGQYQDVRVCPPPIGPG